MQRSFGVGAQVLLSFFKKRRIGVYNNCMEYMRIHSWALCLTLDDIRFDEWAQFGYGPGSTLSARPIECMGPIAAYIVGTQHWKSTRNWIHIFTC